MPSIFSKIVSGGIPAGIMHQDELVTAFRDVNPAAPTHILIVPNQEIASLDGLVPGQAELAGPMLLVARGGYRLVINRGPHGGQKVMHLHMRLMGGRPLGPMLCEA
ncbi:MAG: HIT domain-containing protein [Proteobacteria bacterium]|nr:HIT domain-containing protein [Pseudomonadota bacterium]MBU1452786.1 HIT domain-containing protein [Pseudomonadota bacterium]MBU2469099.1 HIT domain-containing protein [Pseudomonadota bacterium]MBU2519434.1 HIT domain-containing protein [Pseudomonadota bacterium]